LREINPGLSHQPPRDSVRFPLKNRERWIPPDIEQRIWAYLGGIAKENKMKPLQIGGVDDHVHVLLGAPATLAPSEIAQLIKGGSSGSVG